MTPNPTSGKSTGASPKSGDELLFVPLGGAGEIGMNLNLYGYGPPGAHAWIMVDLGITFADAAMPGADVIMPDPAFIEERRQHLAGLVLTHAHEDHLGAVPYLWERLRCPIHATPFTAALLRRKLAAAGLEDAAPITEMPMGGHVSIGPFDLELITLTHSIPEPNAIAIRTPLGTVLHTGDWKFDPDPVIGPTADEDALRRLGGEGVLALVGDSTNALVSGTSGSEADLLASLSDLIGDCANRVVVACFSTNVARLETVAAAARSQGRDTVLVGRSLRRIEEVARETGYLANTPAFVDEEDAGFLPRDKVVLVCTGSQGEPSAALPRIAAGDHPHVTLEAGDTAIFSSRIIPGNEAAIGRLQHSLDDLGVEVVTERDRFVHVSGHPARDELARMYQLVRPRIAVPVHGEPRHLRAHARLARECQVSEAIVAENGTAVRLAPETEIAGQVPAGRLVLNGNRAVAVDGDLVRRRTRALYNGSAVVTVVVNGSGALAAPPQLATIGLLEAGDEAVEQDIIDAVHRAIEAMAPGERSVDDAVCETARIAVRRASRKVLAKNPVTQVHLVRV
jgi:ribonuclease J